MTPRTSIVEDGAYAQRLGCAHFAHLRAVIEDLSPTRPHSTTWPQPRWPAATTAALGESSHSVPNRERPLSALNSLAKPRGRSAAFSDTHASELNRS